MLLELINYLLVLTVLNVLIPTFFARLLHYNVLWKGKAEGRYVVLTFDDGPDPIYTEKVLDILDKYNVKACFFMVGEKVLKYPDVAKQVVKRGHEIGIHAFRHNLRFIINPLVTRKELLKAFDAVKRVTGVSPEYARPPWGCLNPFFYRESRRLNYKVVLWSFMSWDWGRTTADYITKRVLSRVKDGSILIFHDSGDSPGAYNGAPAMMIEALEVIIKQLKNEGYSIKPLGEVC